VLVGLDLDRRPALIRQSQLLAADAPAPLPREPMMIAAPLIVALNGTFAVTYFAETTRNGPPVVLIDFDSGPMSGDTYANAAKRLARLNQECTVLFGGASALWVPEPLLHQLRSRGIAAEAIPRELLPDPVALALSAAGHVWCGSVKVAAPAYAKAAGTPLSGALTFKAGEAMDADPLRLAFLVGIALALDPARLAHTA
jgi:hypothetical protein